MHAAPIQLGEACDPPALATTRSAVPFALFVLVNATLFIRPGEIVPALRATPIYELLILACLMLSLPAVVRQLAPQRLAGEHPIGACVVAMLAVAIFSLAARSDVAAFLQPAADLLKLGLYYLLLVALLDTARRLRVFVRCLLIFLAAMTALAVLQFHSWIDVPALRPVLDRGMDDSGQQILFARLAGAGLFNDPNDLAHVLVFGVFLGLWTLAEQRGVRRMIWLGVTALLVYGIYQTQSRGGFLALVAGVIVLLLTRFGSGKTIFLAGAMLPMLWLLFAGRATDLSIAARGTAGQRIQLWSDAFELFRQFPLLGAGPGSVARGGDMVAHNSFLHAFAEIGLFGGTLFLGAHYLALSPLIARRQTRPNDSDIHRLGPYLAAAVAAYAVAMLFLSRCYAVPTYTVLGIAAVYQTFTAGAAPRPTHRLDFLLFQIAALAALFLLAMYLFVRLTVRWG